MKVCDRCPGACGCLLNYLGKACENWRKKNAPWVFETHGDSIRNMSDEELAVLFAMMKADVSRLDRTVRSYSGREVNDALDWLQQPANGT